MSERCIDDSNTNYRKIKIYSFKIYNSQGY